MLANISLLIQPHRIDVARWEEVYEETLQLLPHCPFMDSYRPGGGKHYYACRTRHRENLLGRGCGGWQVHGDLISGRQMPSFCLYDDIEYYRKGIERPETDVGIFHTALNLNIKCGILRIWDADTIGFELQHYLLGIAILICDRLPDAATITATASSAEFESSADWVNGILEKPVSPLYMHDIPKLLCNLRDVGIAEDRLFTEIYDIYSKEADSETGKAILDNLEFDRILSCLADEFRCASQQGRLSLSAYLIRFYLDCGFALEPLCERLLSDPYGVGADPEAFARMLLRMKLHIEDKIVDTTEMWNEFCKEKDYDTAHDLLSMYMQARGNVNRYIPIDEIVEIFDRLLPESLDFRPIISEIDGQYKSSAEKYYYDRYMQNFGQNALGSASPHFYDIEHEDDLRDYFPGDSISPQTEDRLIKCFHNMSHVSRDIVDEVLKMPIDERIDWFDKHYSIYISKKCENEIYSLMNNDLELVPYIALYATTGRVSIHYAALCNKELLKKYWKLGEELNPDGCSCSSDVRLKNKYELLTPAWTLIESEDEYD